MNQSRWAVKTPLGDSTHGRPSQVSPMCRRTCGTCRINMKGSIAKMQTMNSALQPPRVLCLDSSSFLARRSGILLVLGMSSWSKVPFNGAVSATQESSIRTAQEPRVGAWEGENRDGLKRQAAPAQPSFGIALTFILVCACVLTLLLL